MVKYKARMMSEYRQMLEDPPPNTSIKLVNNSLTHWEVTIIGPQDTVYAGGEFKLDIQFPWNYPFRTPRIRFKTKIYHCNVDENGIFCKNEFERNWFARQHIYCILVTMNSMLVKCDPTDAYNADIAAQYMQKREEFDKIALDWTRRYADAFRIDS
ncbi:ubiquitin-conjugating enzyme E2-24 kDa-like [Teleopsis dalmanni]|uniref:ubiquitin-conjugating enzyme E2-24 kDa-like n=1 Tax=Teleopsis dalmanni TaxID=139649 RepID=UPI0018CDE477|nr:ubiquitin-conjugating enzyme E2-24 kDa-like [Teleopsis dalmanni]